MQAGGGAGGVGTLSDMPSTDIRIRNPLAPVQLQDVSRMPQSVREKQAAKVLLTMQPGRAAILLLIGLDSNWMLLSFLCVCT